MLQFLNRYLVTVWGGSPEAERRLLGRLLVAAMDTREDELDLSAPSLELWRSFGVPPRPSFYLNVPVRLRRTRPAAPQVLHPAVVQTQQIQDPRFPVP